MNIVTVLHTLHSLGVNPLESLTPSLPVLPFLVQVSVKLRSTALGLVTFPSKLIISKI